MTFNLGDIVNYGFYTNVKIMGILEKEYVLEDKRGDRKKISKDLFRKYARDITSNK